MTLSPEIYKKSVESAKKHWAIDWIKDAWGEENYHHFFNMIVTTELTKEEEEIINKRKKLRPKRSKHKMDILDKIMAKECDDYRKKEHEKLVRGNLPCKDLIEAYEMATKKTFVENKSECISTSKQISRGLYGAFVKVDWNDKKIKVERRFR